QEECQRWEDKIGKEIQPRLTHDRGERRTDVEKSILLPEEQADVLQRHHRVEDDVPNDPIGCEAVHRQYGQGRDEENIYPVALCVDGGPYAQVAPRVTLPENRPSP